MSRLALLALAICGCLLAGCGKYGKPTRQPPRDRDAETRYTLPVIPA